MLHLWSYNNYIRVQEEVKHVQSCVAYDTIKSMRSYIMRDCGNCLAHNITSTGLLKITEKGNQYNLLIGHDETPASTAQMATNATSSH